MDFKDIAEKLNLTEEELSSYENSLNEAIEHRANEKAQEIITENLEVFAKETAKKLNDVKKTLTESFEKSKIDEIAKIRENDAKEAATYIKNITESNAIECAQFIKESRETFETTLEEKVTKELDERMNQIIAENFKEDVVEQLALLETYKPIVEGVHKLLTEKYVGVDTEGFDTLKEAQEKVVVAEKTIKGLYSKIETLTESINNQKKSSELIEKKLYLIEKTDGLNDSQKKNIMVMAESMDLNSLKNRLDILIENVIADENNVLDESAEVLGNANDEVIFESAPQTVEQTQRKGELRKINRLI